MYSTRLLAKGAARVLRARDSSLQRTATFCRPHFRHRKLFLGNYCCLGPGSISKGALNASRLPARAPVTNLRGHRWSCFQADVYPRPSKPSTSLHLLLRARLPLFQAQRLLNAANFFLASSTFSLARLRTVKSALCRSLRSSYLLAQKARRRFARETSTTKW